jgi:hypothetical protein
MSSREELGKWLKKQLGVTEEIFDVLRQDLESRGWLSDYDQGQCSDQDVLDTAQELLDTHRRIVSATGDATQLSPPGREGREVPKEVSVQLDDYTHKRAQVFSQLAAALADTHGPANSCTKRMSQSARRWLSMN